MRLLGAELQNYRPYKGKVEVNFPKDQGHNVFILEGRNGSGKTSLHEAIKWCLYAPGGGKKHFNKINSSALEREEKEMRVRLKFQHEGSQYNVVRIAQVLPGGQRAKVKLEIFKDGEPVKANANERQEILNNILPQNVSEFFFFDGEEMESLAGKMNGEEEERDVRENIELLIGLKALQNGVIDLEDVKNTVQNELDEENEKENEKEELNDELEENKENKEKLDEEISDLRDEIEELEAQHNEIQRRLNLIESERLQDLKQLEVEIKNLREERIPTKVDRYKQLIQYGHIFMLDREIKNAIDNLEKKKELTQEELDKVNISQAKEDMVEDSLEQGECLLCKRNLDINAKESLEKSKKEFNISAEETNKLNQRSVRLDDQINSLKKALGNTKGSNPAEIKREIEKLKERKEEKKKAYKKLNTEVTSSEEEESRLQEEKNKLEDKLKNKRGKRESRKEKRENVRLRINEVRKEVDIISVSSHASALKTQKEVITSCIKELNKVRKKLAKKKRDSILLRANEVFEILTSDSRGYDRFEFISEDKYGFQLVTDNEDRPDMKQISKGEKQVVALSFIIGLNRSADRDAPIIMDTPVARLDGEYRENLAALLSDLDEQVILLATDASLSMGFEDILRDDIAGKYEITENLREHTSDIKTRSVR